MSREE